MSKSKISIIMAIIIFAIAIVFIRTAFTNPTTNGLYYIAEMIVAVIGGTYLGISLMSLGNYFDYRKKDNVECPMCGEKEQLKNLIHTDKYSCNNCHEEFQF